MDFRISCQLGSSWPVEPSDIVAFIAFMSLSGRAPSSVNSHISALAFVHNINGWEDPTNGFLIKKLKEGCRRVSPRVDNRLPITPAILEKIVSSLPSICKNLYEVALFRSAFLLAFFGFLRVGEFTCPKKTGSFPRVLNLQDVKVVNSNPRVLEVAIRFSKTDQLGSTVKLSLESSAHHLLCPVKAIREYLYARPAIPGPLFIHYGGDPMTSFQFSHILKEGIKLIGLSPRYFSPHSFRIGAATAAAMAGVSEDEIMKLGRWKSAAFHLYIRPHSWVNV